MRQFACTACAVHLITSARLRLVPLGAAMIVAGCGSPTTGGNDGGGGDMTFVTALHRVPPLVAWQGDAGEDKDAGPQVMRAMRLVSIVAGNDDLANQLLDFGDGVPSSAWYAALSAEYNLGAAGPSVRIKGPDIPDARVDENRMARYIADALAGADPPVVPDGRTMIVLYLPRNTQFLYKGSVNDCNQISMDDKTFGGYHAPYGPLGDMWAPVMRCMLPKGHTALEQLTVFSTLQIASAITNPGKLGYSTALAPGDPPWFSTAYPEINGGNYAEIGEMCSVDTRLVEGQSTYHRFFSNKGAKARGDWCAPALSVPYYNVTTELDWYGGAAGDTLNVQLTGWSTAPVEEWPVRAVMGASGDLLNYGTARVESETNTTINGITYQTINNGQVATLKVSIPLNAKSGWWNVIHVRSFRLDASGAPLAGEDYAHRWTIGAYVP